MFSAPGKVSQAAGFTLLEVMVAIAILAIALTSLLGNQNQSMLAAERTDFAYRSATLARAKMAEIAASPDEPVGENGDFGEDYPGYYWKFEVEQPDFGDSEMLAIGAPFLRRIDLTVHTENERNAFTVSRYVLLGGR